MSFNKKLRAASLAASAALWLTLAPSSATAQAGAGGAGAGGPSDPPNTGSSSSSDSGTRAILSRNPGSRWERCADENQICRFEGDAVVRYGAQGQYVYRVLRNRVICDTQEFGDPAFGQYKSCDVNFDLSQQVGGSGGPPAPVGPVAPGVPATTADGWRYCAGEGQNCSFSGEARVRFGTDNRFVYRNAQGGVRCSTDVFGDPAFGAAKQCQFQPLLANRPKPDAQGWEQCAREGGTCNFAGPAEVRFGANGRYLTRKALNGAPCTVTAFGGDPAFGQSKACQLRYLAR